MAFKYRLIISFDKKGKIKMLINSDCTLYKYNEESKTFDRFYIPSCYWLEYDERSQSRQGQLSTADTTIYLYENSPAFPHSPSRDMLVKGQCPYAFMSTSEQGISADFKEFRERYRFVTVMKINNLMFGSLPHYEIFAK